MAGKDILGTFVAGILSIAALSLIFAPNSTVAVTVKSVGESMANVIRAAKAYPAG